MYNQNERISRSNFMCENFLLFHTFFLKTIDNKKVFVYNHNYLLLKEFNT